MSVLGEYVIKLASDERELVVGLKKSQSAVEVLDKSIVNASQSILKLGAAYLAVNFSVNNIVKMADEYTKLTAQLRNATTSQVEYDQAMQNTAQIAQLVQADVGAVGAVYARLTNSLRDLGASQNDINDVTKTLALSLRVNGASAQETSSVMLQLSQAFGSGKLAGDEFRSAMEGAPNLMRELARSMNVPVGSLKDLASEGKITSQVMLDAFTNKDFIARLEKQNSKIKLVEGAFTNLKNAVIDGIGEIDTKIDASGFFSDALGGLAGTINPKYAPKNSVIDNLNKLAALGRQFALNSVGIKTTAQEQAEQARKDAIAKAGIFGGANPITYNAPVAPNFNQGYVVQDVNKVHQAQEERARKTAKLNGEVKSAYDSLITSIKKKIDTQALEITMTEPLSEAQKLLIDINSEIASGQLKVNAAQKANIDSLINKLALGETEIAQLNAQKIAQENYYKLIDDAANKRKDEAQSLVEKADAQDLELRMLTMSKSELVELEKARYNEQIAVLESEKAFLATNPHRKEEVVLIEKQIEALGRLRDNVGKSDALQETQRAKDEFFNSMEAQAHRVWSIFANEGGQSFKAIGQSLKAYVLDMLYQLTLKKFFVNISASFGATSTGVSQVSALASNGSLVDGIVGAFSKTNLAITNTLDEAIQGLSGDLISNGFEKLGGILQNNSATIAKFAPYAGAALQLAQGNWAGAAGTALGTAIGGPIGGLLGSALGSFVGGMFGGRVSTKKYSAGATGSYSDGVFSGNGLTGLAGYGRNAGGQDALIGGLEAYSKAFGGLLKGFGLNDSIITNAQVFQRSSKKTRGWGYFGANFDGGSVDYSTGHVGSADNAVNAIINWLLGPGMVRSIQKSKLPEGVRLLFDGLTDRSQIGNMIAASMSLADAQEALLNRYGLTADLAGKVSIASGLAADDLAKFVTALSGAAFSSQKASEQLIQQREKLNALIGDAGGDIGTNASLNAFDAYLKSIDKQTAQGQAKFADLFMLRDSVGTMQQAWDQLMGNVGVAVYELLPASEQLKKDQDALNKLFAEYGLQVPKTADELAKLGQSIQQNFNAADEASIDLAMAFPTLVQAFMKAKDQVIEGGREMSDFTNLADFRAYKGVLNNYGATIANDYARVNGLVGNNRAGATTFEGAQIDMLAVLKEMRQLSKDALNANRETAATLERITRQGLKTV